VTAPTTTETLAARRNGLMLDGAEWRSRLGERPTIVLSGDLADVTRAAWAAIDAANSPPFLFSLGSLPVRLERDDSGALVTRVLTLDRARYVLARVAEFIEPKKGRGAAAKPAEDTFPPLAVVHDVLAKPEPPLPKLTSIVEVPVLTRDGRIREVPGYDPAAGVYFEPPSGFVLPAVPAHPTARDLVAAVALIADDLLGDFPFLSLTERAHAIGLLVLPFVRELIDGPTPLHVAEAPGPGHGKTLLLHALLAPALGRPPALMAHPGGRNDEEMRKRLTAILASGCRAAVFDNLHGRLDSAALATALTAREWTDRLLGRTEMTSFPVTIIWAASANNATLSLEMARRSVRMRLDAGAERPWQRTGFRHSNLMAWTLEHRPALVAAALTMGRAWIDAGRPPGPRGLGMFESWARVVGGILTVAGLEGFLGNLDDLYETADRDGAELRAFIAAWWAAHGSERRAAADLVTLEPLPGRVAEGKDTGCTRRLGNLLADLRDRRFTVADADATLTVKVEQAGEQRGASVWRLLQVDHVRV
jgi:putative DNA primase/helicase